MKRYVLMCIAVFIFVIAPVPCRAASYQVVVQKANPIESISKSELADVFLKKATRWRNGRSVTPVDQADRNSIRAEFDLAVLGKEVAWVKSYWQRMIFSGRATPPPELANDAEVLDFIRTNPDAVGYVSDGASLGGDIKALKVTD